MKNSLRLIIIIAFLFSSSFAQFGKNKVQYKKQNWYYIQTKHFDLYFTKEGVKIADFAAHFAEKALDSLQNSLKYSILNRITIILTNSFNDFQETNTIDEEISEGIGGFTELFKNRVVIPFEGDYAKFRHVLHHELTHAVMNDMFFGGSIQNIISKNLNFDLPLWFIEGMAEYQSLKWDKHTDMFVRDALINEFMPNLTELNDYFAYRGGQSVLYYIYKKYGDEKIAEITNKARSTGRLETAFKLTLGMDFEEFNDKWRKELKKMYFPDVKDRKYPDEFSKKLTNHKKDGGFYNTSPAISPQGDKIAFITNRDIFFSIYLMSAIDGKIIKRVLLGNTTNDFEDLNILTPGLTWSPDGKFLAFSASSEGYDIIYKVDIEKDKFEKLPFKFLGISSVSWSPDGNKIAFVASNSSQSDIYIYDFTTNELTNVTNDIFSDSDPSWDPFSRYIVFSSDRGDFVSGVDDTFAIKIHNFYQKDLYLYDIKAKKIVRVTNIPDADETSPIFLNNGNEILFISDKNGINNIYRKTIIGEPVQNKEFAITNSMNSINQISLSKDNKRLAYTAMYEGAYNIFLINNPLNFPKYDSLPPTLFVQNKLFEFYDTINIKKSDNVKLDDKVEQNENRLTNFVFVTGQNEISNDSLPEFKKMLLDTSLVSRNVFNPLNNLDENGNYIVRNYKVNFTPDIVYANAGYSTFYGLMGTTLLAFSDVLGNHRIYLTTSLQVDLKNSDYGVAYYNLENRMDYGFEAYHTARFAYLDKGRGDYELYRFRNYGGGANFSYPFSKFYRMDFGLSWMQVTAENLDYIDIPIEKITYTLPSISFVHDNTLWGYISPIEGTRYNITSFGQPAYSKKDSLSFISFVLDYRHYIRFWYDNSIVLRFSAGYSTGKNPQRFFIGGTENWINSVFSNNPVPIENASDFAFLTPALPLRGFDYAEKIGHKYSLINIEYRFPLLGIVATRGLPLLFRNFLGVMFIDAGAAWNKNKELQLFAKSKYNNTITKDLLLGTGFGTRMILLGFLVRFDAAWGYQQNHFSSPRYYFSLGYDF
ncbi:MAG TPA: biopolymer transporter Tol [Ignavibacteriales bacterium]|nr:biopolymer transporter Tol [Ignavibacteriales bacterium]